MQMVIGALIFAAGCFFGAVMVYTGEQLGDENRK